MTRTQKIERIKLYRPGLYRKLCRHVPNLVINPEHATQEDVETYNYFVACESSMDRNNIAFKNRFSF